MLTSLKPFLNHKLSTKGSIITTASTPTSTPTAYHTPVSPRRQRAGSAILPSPSKGSFLATPSPLGRDKEKRSPLRPTPPTTPVSSKPQPATTTTLPVPVFIACVSDVVLVVCNNREYHKFHYSPEWNGEGYHTPITSHSTCTIAQHCTTLHNQTPHNTI